MLEHSVQQEDLMCSEDLWEKSSLNPLQDSVQLDRTCKDLLNLHSEPACPLSGLMGHQRYHSWKFRAHLYEHGSHYFRKFKASLGLPELVEQIPIMKMGYAPARSMDVNESTHAGNISAITNLLHQGGVGDPSVLTEKEKKTWWLKKTASLLKHVVLFFGDLATFEHVMAILQRWSMEGTPWHRFQFVIFVMGVFHLKMAAADAIWRILIEPKTACEDATSLIAFVALHRPWETGEIEVFTLPLVFRPESGWSPGIPPDWSRNLTFRQNLHGIQQEFMFFSLVLLFRVQSDVIPPDWQEFRGTDGGIQWDQSVIVTWSHLQVISHVCLYMIHMSQLVMWLISSTNTNDTVATNKTQHPWPMSAPPPRRPQQTTIEDDCLKTRTNAWKQKWMPENNNEPSKMNKNDCHHPPQATNDSQHPWMGTGNPGQQWGTMRRGKGQRWRR
jgi:hypothetical protein